MGKAKRLIIVIAILILGVLTIQIIFKFIDKRNWFDFYIKRESASGSIVDAGKVLLDAPAGKHGYLTVKDGHFAFNNGQRIRFWGVNLSYEANFPIHDEAIRTAEHIARSGFNIVRLHHMDSDTGTSIFQNPCDNTIELSSENLDRLDYLIYQLKIRGIYVDINLHVSRSFTIKDGVLEADKLPLGSKYVTLFNSKAIELQKDYAMQLLTHINPYTGIAYAQDPAIALIELTNENSLFSAWINGCLFNDTGFSIPHDKENKFVIPGYYASELDYKWNIWLKNKYYPSDNSTDMENDVEPRSPYNSRSGNIERLKWSDVYNHSEAIFEDNARFYTELEIAYFKDMIGFLKEGLGINVPITTTNNYICQPGLYSQMVGDYIDAHNYWDHPTFQGAEWDTLNFEQTNKSMVANEGITAGVTSPTAFFGRLSLSAVSNKPLVVSEWSQPFPNDFQYESSIIVAAYALLQDWDGVFIYSYDAIDNMGKSIKGWFDFARNPILLSQMPACAAMFIRGDVSSARRKIELNYTEENVFGKAKYHMMDVDYLINGSLPASIIFKSIVRKGSLNSSSTTNVADIISQDEMKALLEEKKHISDTGELLWDVSNPGEEYVKINTDLSQGVSGNIAGKEIRTGNLYMLASKNSSITLTSMDGNSIKKSSKMLLTVAARVRNKGQIKNKATNGLVSIGSGSAKVEKVRGHIKIKLDNAVNYGVYALDPKGNRVQQVKTIKNGQSLEFQLSGNTLWYEISLL